MTELFRVVKHHSTSKELNLCPRSSFFAILVIHFISGLAFSQDVVAPQGKSNQEQIRASLSIDVASLREEYVLDVGEVETGDRASYEIHLKNLLGLDLSPTSIEKSCGCVSAEVSSKSWGQNQPLTLKVSLHFPETDSSFAQQVTIVDKSPAISPLVLRIKARVKAPIELTPRVLSIKENTLDEHTCVIKSLNVNDDFSKTTVTTSMQGVEVSVSERKKDSLALRLTVNSDKSFRGNVNETVLLNVKDVQRGDTTKTYLLSVKLSFDEILVTVPKKLVFSLEGDMLVGKLYLHSSRFELIDKQNNPNNNKLLTAGTESQNDLFKTDFKILRPSLGTVTVTIPRDHTPRPEVVRIAIPSLSQSVTLPADFLSN